MLNYIAKHTIFYGDVFRLMSCFSKSWRTETWCSNIFPIMSRHEAYIPALENPCGIGFGLLLGWYRRHHKIRQVTWILRCHNINFLKIVDKPLKGCVSVCQKFKSVNYKHKISYIKSDNLRGQKQQFIKGDDLLWKMVILFWINDDNESESSVTRPLNFLSIVSKKKKILPIFRSEILM